jgi:hypothetical protein
MIAFFFCAQFVPMYLDVISSEKQTTAEYVEVEAGANVLTRDAHGHLVKAVVVAVEDNPDATRNGKVFRLTLEHGGGEKVVLRSQLWARQELNAPQSVCAIGDILPATREVKPPSFMQLQRKGVAAADMKAYVNFSHRHAFSTNEWFPVLKKHAYKMQCIALDESDVRALLDEDWSYLMDVLPPKIAALMQSSDLATNLGLIPRISTRVPCDEATARCVLTNAQAEALQVEKDLGDIVARYKRGRPLPLRLSLRLELPDYHVPDRKDVAAAKARVKKLTEVSMQMRRRVGQARMDKLGIVPRDKVAEIAELEEERDNLVTEYTEKILIEKERLSLIDQMHSGPKQTQERTKARARLKYYQDSLADTKEVNALTIALQ